MILRTLQLLTDLWTSMAIGCGLSIAGMGLGWVIARFHLWPTDLVHWWLERVVIPCVRARSWSTRAAFIFTNNAAILIALLALGTWPWAGTVAVLVAGAGVGMALQLLLKREQSSCQPANELSASQRRRVAIGAGLQIVELPAIVVALGLSVGGWSIPLSFQQVWETFVVWVVPAMLVAACGEALWLGEIQPDRHIHQTAL